MIRKTSREEMIEGLVAGMLDRINDLEYGVGPLYPAKPFEWFMIPIEEKITHQETMELFHAYKLRLEVDSETRSHVAYNVYKMM